MKVFMRHVVLKAGNLCDFRAWVTLCRLCPELDSISHPPSFETAVLNGQKLHQSACLPQTIKRWWTNSKQHCRVSTLSTEFEFVNITEDMALHMLRDIGEEFLDYQERME